MSTPSTIALSFPEKDIAVLTFDEPGKAVNILSRHVVDELEVHLNELEKRSDLVGLILTSAKPGVFIAGADIREFISAGTMSRADIIQMASHGRKLFQRISRLPFVSVAAINGICVGGGAELAVWCDRRLMSSDPKAQIGFPEVKLGIFPGWGGTARTPRLTGLGNAIELITGGESISGTAAVRMGLVTDVVPTNGLLQASIAVVRADQKSQQYLKDRERWHRALTINPTEHAFLGATAGAFIQQQSKGQYPAPQAALNLMMTTAAMDSDAACEKESEGFAELFGSPVSRALINVFFLGDRNKKDTGSDNRSLTPVPIRSVGVIGAGIMGSGIASACVKRELNVALTDARLEQLTSGARSAIEDAAYDRVARGPVPEKLLKLAPLLREVTSDAEFAKCDLVIEAIVENEKVKKDLHTRMEAQLSDNAILASNTSAISIGRLAEGLRRPERFCGIHFFNPVRRMQLVEVIRGPKTSDETVVTAVSFAKGLGKMPIVVADGPGFLVNRLLFPYMNEAIQLLMAGIPIKAVDGASRAFGMPMGPITLYDVVGLDTALFAGQVMTNAFPSRFLSSPLLETLVKAGRLGQKSGAGFFAYRDKSDRGEPDPGFDSILAAHADAPQKLDAEAVTMRLFIPMLLEATRVLEEKKVRDPRDVDLGLIYGIGFPPFRGGLMHWADTIGPRKIVEMLKPFEPLGERYHVTPLLKELADSGRRFYDLVKES